MKRYIVVLSLVLLGACTEENDVPPWLGDGALPESGIVCSPNAFLACQGGSQLLRCNPTGTGTVTVSCSPYLCDVKLQACTGCTNQTYYRDADGDGYGNPNVKTVACGQPVGYASQGLDCDDADAAAHPGQQAYFSVPTKGTKNYDYDCDKLEEQQHRTTASCTLAGMACTGDGWVGTIPSCGATGTWGNCNKSGAGRGGCSLTPTSKVQSCH